jgi:hypothetical protein
LKNPLSSIIFSFEHSSASPSLRGMNNPASRFLADQVSNEVAAARGRQDFRGGLTHCFGSFSRHSHGGIGYGSAHKPFRSSLIPVTRPAPHRVRATSPVSGAAARSWVRGARSGRRQAYWRYSLECPRHGPDVESRVHAGLRGGFSRIDSGDHRHPSFKHLRLARFSSGTGRLSLVHIGVPPAKSLCVL